MTGLLTVGSMCSGGGGLDMAVEQLLPGSRVAWCAETDPHALDVYQQRWQVPNLGDLSAVDWTQVEPVDVLVGGYPCQPWSTAGRRKGQEDDRDGWPWFRDAIRHLGPRLVLLENVRGHVVPSGAGRTVGDLSDLGYDAVWTTLRASDVGAPHRRARWFCAAYPNGDGLPLVGRLDAVGRDTDRCDGARQRPATHPEGGGEDVTWGDYGPAIRRWEATLGRPAPAPTDDRGRLSPPFVEWMMGWPAGHVAGVPRTAALRILGNGVVPLQAAAAYRQLLTETLAEEAA